LLLAFQATDPTQFTYNNSFNYNLPTIQNQSSEVGNFGVNPPPPQANFIGAIFALLTSRVIFSDSTLDLAFSVLNNIVVSPSPFSSPSPSTPPLQNFPYPFLPCLSPHLPFPLILCRLITSMQCDWLNKVYFKLLYYFCNSLNAQVL
jgi:hypothetical protein